MEIVLPVGRDERDEEALRVGELPVREERREEGEEEGRGPRDGRVVGLAPSEEGEESVGTASEGFGGEDWEEEGRREAWDVRN